MQHIGKWQARRIPKEFACEWYFKDGLS